VIYPSGLKQLLKPQKSGVKMKKKHFWGSVLPWIVGIAGLVLMIQIGIRLQAQARGGQAGQAAAPAYRAPRTADNRPNLNGIWQSMNEANWDIQPHAANFGRVVALGAADAVPPGLGIVDGGEIPYLPSALAQKRQNFEKRLSLDPEIKCYLPGVPRAMYQNRPFQVIQSSSVIMMVFEFAGAVRTINMGKPTEAPADSWMGWSNGRWEGETLVIDSTGFNDMSWFDRAGNFHSDALHVVERITATSPDHLNYEATIEDKNVFSRPWKISMPLYRRKERNAQVMEFKCVEFVEELIYGHLRKQPTTK
jgi:hypothetical protein